MLIEKNEYEGYRSIEDKLKPLPFETAHTSVDKVVVGIIGAGAAGLYAALILESLGKKYEILESSPRTGGRLFTHKFSEKPADYFVSQKFWPFTDFTLLSGRWCNAFSQDAFNEEAILLVQL